MRYLQGLLIGFSMLAAGATAVLVVPSPAVAVDVLSPICQQQPNADVCKDNQTASGDSNDDNPLFGPNGIITKVMQIMVAIVGILAVITLMISGVKFITSGGDADGAASARRGVLYAMVGVLIAMLAQAIVSFVLSKL